MACPSSRSRSTCQTLQKFAIRGHPLRPSALGLKLRHQPRPHEGERALVAEQRSKQVQTEDIGGKRDVIGLEGLSKNEAPLPKRPRTTRSPSSKSPPPLPHAFISLMVWSTLSFVDVQTAANSIPFPQTRRPMLMDNICVH